MGAWRRFNAIPNVEQAIEEQTTLGSDEENEVLNSKYNDEH
jgi:hypothetical protein